MIDLHCHILPGLDDGAADLEDAVAMARQAAADGIEVICATPHIRADHDVDIAEIATRAAALAAALRERGIGVRIEPAGEVAEEVAGELGDDELARVAIGGRWVLLEPRPGPLSDSLLAACERLAARGYRALIAHPERHPAADLGERLAAAVAAGSLVQLTAAHLAADDALGEAMRELAGRGLVHVLGSDAHSSLAGRPVRLSPAVERLREVPPVAPHVGWIAREAPAAIVAGRDPAPPYPSR